MRQQGLRHRMFWLLLAASLSLVVEADTQVRTYTTPGTHSFTAPAFVSQLTVEVWGGGGRGDGFYGGGGGGGAYARSDFNVSAGAVFSLRVGGGSVSNSPGEDSWFSSATMLMAKGGNSTNRRTGASGGAAADSIGSIRYSGGNGTSGSPGLFGLLAYGGGAGSSAGIASNGTNGSYEYGGTAPAGGGNGGTGAGTFLILFGGAGEPGYSPGGGGGGGSTLGGGRGGNGRVRITYVRPDIHHFELSHSGSGLTCRAEPITVRACSDAACSTTFNDAVTVALSPGGWVGGSTVAFSGGQATVPLRKASAGFLTLGVTSSSPQAGNLQTLCRAGGGSASTAACTLEFHNSKLEYSVPDVVAAKDSAAFKISAIATDPATSACVPAFSNVTQPVSFWTIHENPAGVDLTATPGISVNGETTGVGIGGATDIDLVFDAQGQASVAVNYPEAGQVQLVSVYRGDSSRGDEGLVMLGYDSFISTPAGFCIEAPDPRSSCSTTALADCTVLAEAGEPFELRARAVAWQADGETGAEFCAGNPTTTNFRHTGLTLSHTLVAPAGGSAGTLATTSAPFTSAGAGTSILDQAVSEVGVFRFRTNAGETYLGRGLPAAESAAIGRFTPANFLVTVPDAGELEAFCDAGTAFTYIGQPIQWSLLPEIWITARNRAGVPTLNYINDFQKLSVNDIARLWPTSDNAQPLTDGSGNLPVTHEAGAESLSPVTPGTMSFNFSATDELVYTKLSTAKVAPFEPQLTFGLEPFSDADGVAPSLPLPDISPGSDFLLGFGRLYLENVSGPENIDELLMPFQTQYWDGNRFVTTSVDDCTAWATTDIAYSGSHGSMNPGSGFVTAGVGSGLALVPAGTQGTDTATWTVPVWLQHDWDGDGVLDNPQGLATFGVHRGHDRILYWREAP